jgi:hypothetical protein
VDGSEQTRDASSSENVRYPMKTPRSRLTRGNWQSSTTNGSAGRLPAASISKSLRKATKSATRVTKSIILQFQSFRMIPLLIIPATKSGSVSKPLNILTSPRRSTNKGSRNKNCSIKAELPRKTRFVRPPSTVFIRVNNASPETASWRYTLPVPHRGRPMTIRI